MTPYTSPSLYGIIGYPVRHSLSPLLHTTAFRTLKLPGILLPWEVPPDRLPVFIESVRLLDIRGCCVTIPHKKKLLPLVDETTEQARAVGAANTIYRVGDAIAADNTDVAGFLAPLLREKIVPETPVLLLGAGGAARAAAVGLVDHGFHSIFVTSRSDRTAIGLSEEFDLEFVPWRSRCEVAAGLLVNATPLGMKGDLESETPYPGKWLAGRDGIVYDMIYTPLETRLLREAALAGWRTVTGLGMFIAQAEYQFLRWTGHGLPAEAKHAVVNALYGDSFQSSHLMASF